MAKYGNFVTKKHLEFSKDEINKVIKNIHIYFNSVFSNDFNLKIDHTEIYFTGFTNVFKIYFDKKRVGRNYIEKSRYEIEGIVISLRKCKGVLEISFEDKVYEDFNDYQYNIDIKAMGYKIPFKKRNKEYIYGCTFDFNTDLDVLINDVMKSSFLNIRKQVV